MRIALCLLLAAGCASADQAVDGPPTKRCGCFPPPTEECNGPCYGGMVFEEVLIEYIESRAVVADQ